MLSKLLNFSELQFSFVKMDLIPTPIVYPESKMCIKYLAKINEPFNTY